MEYQLIDDCKGGDREAVGRLFEIYWQKFFSIALRISGDHSLAMDIAQDTFLKLLSSIRDFRGDSKFDAWAYRLLLNGYRDHHRRTRRFVPMADTFLCTLRGSADSSADLLRAELQACVRSAIKCLPTDQRSMVMLRYADGLSYAEIASALGCSAGTVASRLTARTGYCICVSPTWPPKINMHPFRRYRRRPG
jgi:RNA polymerase sigma-70 factor (ECF subfamily)